MDDRLTVVETKLAYLEDMVFALNDLVAQQQRDLDALRATKERLEARLAELIQSSGDVPQQRPPHY
ncbi:MAG TPA: SlyX family protein [Sphaerochaetaceae bacterium]|jgi:uncharacterized coiled-coil protein SlyX|nr:SlyX family protein [Sphaerochaetaceae bacterium]